ncbi:MAG: class I SAM-dependent methyltransferase [Ilumatobacteraceae bacterium]|jgi:SAM-dependent methyltransferase|nr:class I SAM-dependent methyltransferase [Ilumatobacteraceae bacterium]
MDHTDIVRICADDFARFGDTFEGAGWTKTEEEADRRYAVMLDLMPASERPFTLLDFGCGAARLLDYALRTGRAGELDYSGLDLSPVVIEHCRHKHPDRAFYSLDVLDSSHDLPVFDAIVLNGVFTFKGEMTQQQMFDYLCAVLCALRPHVRFGLAFNVASTHVDWTRDDLFHLPIGQVTDFVASTLSRRFMVRHDYGLYEYTVYVYL